MKELSNLLKAGLWTFSLWRIAFFSDKGISFSNQEGREFEIGLCDEQIPSSVLFPMGKCIFRYCGKIIKAETSPILSCSPSNYCKEAQWERDFSIFTLEKRRKVVSFRNCKSFHLVLRRRSTRLGCHFSWIDEQKKDEKLGSLHWPFSWCAVQRFLKLCI